VTAVNEARITSKGQVTIPREVLDHLGVAAGDRVRFFLHPDGEVVARPVVPAARLRGILARPGRRKVSVEEMNEAIALEARERNKP
jgi:antitoxin PrlF